jgi:hypothetical protein
MPVPAVTAIARVSSNVAILSISGCLSVLGIVTIGATIPICSGSAVAITDVTRICLGASRSR